MVRRYIFETRWPEHSHSPILGYKQHPQGPAPHPHYIECCPDTSQIYATYMSTSTVPELRQRHNRCKHSVAASRSCPFSREVSDASAVNVIGSSVLEVVSYLILIIVYALIQLTVSDLTWLTVSNLIWLTIYDFIRFTVFDWIWFSFFIRFNTCLMYFFHT